MKTTYSSAGNYDGARIHAQNAIRKKNEALNYLKLSSQLDNVASQLSQQAKTQAISKSMSGIVKTLDVALKSNNITQVATTMAAFEKQQEDLAVQSAVIEDTFNQQVTLAADPQEVDNYVDRCMEEQGMEQRIHVPIAGTEKPVPVAKKEEDEEDDLAARLANLRKAS
jgi:charged multivesicular body protein 1